MTWPRWSGAGTGRCPGTGSSRRCTMPPPSSSAPGTTDRPPSPERVPSLRHVLEVAGGHEHPDLNYPVCFERGLTLGSCAPAVRSGGGRDGARPQPRRRPTRDPGRRRLPSRRRALAARRHRRRVLVPRTHLRLPRSGRPVARARAAPPPVRRHASSPTIRGFRPTSCAGVGSSRSTWRRSSAAATSSYVLAVPTPDNRHLVSRALMELLGPDDVLAVISRAHLVDFDAMTELVLDGRFRAAIDVFPEEPLAPTIPSAGRQGRC